MRFLLDEHVPPRFAQIVSAHGHSVVDVRQTTLCGADDHLLLQNLGQHRCDMLLTLDANREPEVWSRVMNELADGEGRMLRTKVKSNEVPAVQALNRYWAACYEGFEPHLTDRSVVLVQVGRPISGARLLKGGFRTYAAADIGTLVQQSFNLTPSNQLLQPGSPGLGD